jgi:uncharacterized protein with von Willebrand factor type A (vWA) domain
MPRDYYDYRSFASPKVYSSGLTPLHPPSTLRDAISLGVFAVRGLKPTATITSSLRDGNSHRNGRAQQNWRWQLEVFISPGRG